MKLIDKILVLVLIIVIVFSLILAYNIYLDKSKEEVNQEDNPRVFNVFKKFKSPYSEKKHLIEIGEKLVVEDFCELEFKDYKLDRIIYPPKKEFEYTYYKVEDEENIFLDLAVEVKSLLEEVEPAANFVSLELKYKDKYSYQPFVVAEENNGRQFTSVGDLKIQPLHRHILHFITEIPEEVYRSQEPLSFIVRINRKKYELKLR